MTQTPDALTRSRFVIGAMAAGLVVFGIGAVVFVEVMEGMGPASADFTRLLVAVGVAIVVGVILLRDLATRFWYKRIRTELVREARPGVEPDLTYDFFKVTLLRAGAMELVAFFGLVGYLVTSSRVLLLFYVVGLFLLLREWPSHARYDEFHEALTHPAEGHA